MLPTHHLLEFLLTVYLLILIPGPSVLFVVSRGVALGRRAALASGSAREWLGSSPRRLERLTGAGGVTLIGLGVGLAITGRKH
jgi:threonine/homoserine/homoserine lactone efflux protein